MLSNILYCFISHSSVFKDDIPIITDMCNSFNLKDYLIACGGYDTNKVDGNILYLNCDDTYEGLSDKTHKLLSYVSKNYPGFDYYGKLDRLIRIRELIPSSIMAGDYCGSWVKIKDGFDGDRKWHFGKCSKDSVWNNKHYPGKFIPWCRGGSGYFLSPKAANTIANHPPLKEGYHLYEDLYVSQTLLDHASVAPRHIKNLKDYLYDSEFEE